ncbi:MAG: hypothetical protein A2606_03530 [Candidatus Yanofskybacteria bacterium RIFOXYD1_FULL_42_10]|uniref:Uncharacterized protein n=1 Tax=Candidatus Yanofskybacteria bacterium RIFOXYD1_FULL_42_10 TaxID=1802718 RepID=A0A1F8HS23_9BACT|nr:MAG: hypothetical protein A3C64_02875 [Candidatus Yanofskybacteria bacterium RIFCSPHIGHO2_02_FULL_41_12]OGN21931.1 MAG: hypothetical protein A3B00_01190 [Candidatus Yanofskybacteria bacterium RIFCSPLOWO2_01_FULL_41_33]OGN39820.1 MAG: hypothetical protein A2606_03530 [Candidatus Yanofskybacteria bacterium RIFOXYD1_FULL_42_10]
MITLCLQRNRKTIFAAISPEIHKRMRVFAWTNNISLQDIMEFVYNQFGNISQKSIAKYLQNSGNQPK